MVLLSSNHAVATAGRPAAARCLAAITSSQFACASTIFVTIDTILPCVIHAHACVFPLSNRQGLKQSLD